MALLSSISAPRRNSPRHRDQGRCGHLGANLHPDVFAFGLRNASPASGRLVGFRTQTGFRQCPACRSIVSCLNSFACPQRPPQKEPLKCSGVAYLHNSCLAPSIKPQAQHRMNDKDANAMLVFVPHLRLMAGTKKNISENRISTKYETRIHWSGVPDLRTSCLHISKSLQRISSHLHWCSAQNVA